MSKIKKIRKIARVWSLVLIVIVLLISGSYVWNWITTGKADPHAVEDYPPIENLPPILEFVGVLGLAIAWRWEGLGGMITVISLIAALPVLLIHWPIIHDFPRYFIAPYGTWVIIMIPGILFLICYQRQKNRD